MRYSSRLGNVVEKGQELARLYLRAPSESLVRDFEECFVVENEGSAPPLIVERLSVDAV